MIGEPDRVPLIGTGLQRPRPPRDLFPPCRLLERPHAGSDRKLTRISGPRVLRRFPVTILTTGPADQAALAGLTNPLIEDGKVVEHWDNAEPVPPEEEWVESGKFRESAVVKNACPERSMT